MFFKLKSVVVFSKFFNYTRQSAQRTMYCTLLKVFQGYIDDPRNTDNSWMESQAVNYHDDNGKAFDKFTLKAGDDAKHVKWMEASHDIHLYANHNDMVREVARRLDAFW